MDYSIVIPVYAGEKSLRQLVKELHTFFEDKPYSFEIIGVWDGGSLQSKKTLQALKSEYTLTLQDLYLSRNFGQHNATIAGISQSKGRFVITMDEDLQHNPNDISKLIHHQKSTEADVVYGRYSVKQHNIFRNITSNALAKLIKIGIPELHPHYTSFRLIRGETGRSICSFKNSYTFLDGYLSWVTSNFTSCEIAHHKREEGKSSYTISKLINHSINIFITFSNLPIKAVNALGVLFIAVTSVYLLYNLVLYYLLGGLLPGFLTITILLGMGFGCTLVTLGVLAQYLMRINQKTTNRPNFIFSSQNRSDE